MSSSHKGREAPWIRQNDDSGVSTIYITGSINDEILKILSNIKFLEAGMEKNLVNVEINIDRVEKEMAHNDNGYMLLLYNRPEKMLAAAVEAKESLEAVLVDWYENAKLIMKMYTKYRRRTIMVDLETACLNSTHLLSVLGKRLNLELNTLELEPVKARGKEPNFVSLIAHCCVQENYDVKFMSASLEAGSIKPVINNKPNWTQMLMGFRDEYEEMQSKVQITEMENELLLLQVPHLQEEVESCFTKNQELLKSVDESVHVLTESLSKSNFLENELVKMSHSRSWKITAPLRSLFNLLGISSS